MSCTVRAALAGSSASSQPRGLPVSTAQNRQARVQTSPISISVAVPAFQHSPMFGHLASSQTVASRCSRTAWRTASKRWPAGMGARSHDGLRPAGSGAVLAVALMPSLIAVMPCGVTYFRPLRAALGERFVVGLPEVEARTPSEDGAEKFLFRLADGAKVEAVFLPASRRRSSGTTERVTVCVSSQAGCALACAFCVTGRMGAGRNLTAREILGQYLVVAREKGFGPRAANVVFMGMGEPLLNVASVSRALDLLEAEVSPRRTTVSTAGIVPGIRELAKRDPAPISPERALWAAEGLLDDVLAAVAERPRPKG